MVLDFEQVHDLSVCCHTMNIRVSLGDFGTGFSNLGHLHELEFDIVKLDQAFTRQMMTSTHCFELVRGIVNMIHSVGAKVIADGVEYLQGWYIGKPALASEMADFLRRKRLP